MGLLIPENIVKQTNMTAAELLLEFAVFLYQSERLTLAQSARLSNQSRISFQQIIAKRRIPIHFNHEDLKQELDTIESVKNAYRQRHLASQQPAEN